MAPASAEASAGKAERRAQSSELRAGSIKSRTPLPGEPVPLSGRIRVG